MDLHPEHHVQGFLGAHRRTLASYHDYLDRAVPKAYAKWEEEYPDPYDLPGDTLCNAVRTLVWKFAEDQSLESPSLMVARGPPNSRQLVDGHGHHIRIRRHPWQYQYCRRVPVTLPQIDTLWGTDITMARHELAILWTPNPKAKALDSAVLAAVHGLDTPSVAIYYRAELPTPTSTERTNSSRQISDDLQISDDFGDFIDDEFTGEDPA